MYAWFFVTDHPFIFDEIQDSYPWMALVQNVAFVRTSAFTVSNNSTSARYHQSTNLQ